MNSFDESTRHLRLLRPLILASASPQRRTLLADLGEPFEVRPADVDETPPPGPLAAAVRAIARRKADRVAQQVAQGCILAADTVIDLDGVLLGKPADGADAKAMLARLSGRAHAVHTGVALCHRPSGRAVDGVATSIVLFRRLADDEIDAYVATGEPMGKAGAYAIQGGAARFVTRLDGDLDNVVGLPLALVRQLLEQLGRAAATRAP